MPFKSESQRRFMYAAEARGELPKGTAERWQAHTPKGAKLPEHVAKGKKKGKGMKKEAAFFVGFDKRADQVAGAMGDQGQGQPAEAAAPGAGGPSRGMPPSGGGGPPPPPEKLMKWNTQGGVDPRSPEEMAAAQAVDLVTLPEGVEGTNCGNCQFFRGLDPALGTGFCTNPQVKLDVTTRMRCNAWNAPDTYRAWEQVDASAVPDPQIMQEAGALEAGELPVDPNAVGPDGQPLAGAGGAPAEGGGEKKPKEKPKKDKDSEKKSEGGKGGETNVHVHVGGAGEKEEKGEKKAYWRGFDHE